MSAPFTVKQPRPLDRDFLVNTLRGSNYCELKLVTKVDRIKGEDGQYHDVLVGVGGHFSHMTTDDTHVIIDSINGENTFMVRADEILAVLVGFDYVRIQV